MTTSPNKLGSAIRAQLVRALPALFAKPVLQGIHKIVLRIACKGLGMLNSDPAANGEYWFLSKFGKHFKVVLDVGANAGNYAIQALRSCPAATIYCFEPHPVSLSLLRERLSKEPRAHIVPKALGRESGMAILFDHAEHQGSEHASLVADVIEVIHRTESERVKVEVTTLDEFVESVGLQQLDFLKIDTEGGEKAVLQGAVRTIARLRPIAVQIEFNEMNLLSGYSLYEMKQQLDNYELYRLLPGALCKIEDFWSLENKVFAYQNVVAVRNDPSMEVPIALGV